MSGLERLDVALFRWVNGAAHAPPLDLFFVWLTRPPYRAVLVAALLLLLVWTTRRRGREAIVPLVLAIALADQLSANLLKDWIDRVRPCFALEDVRLLLPRQARSHSFPSSHAANSFAAAIVLWRVGGAWRWGSLVAAALIGYSRVYVGVHYPSDVAGGALLGAMAGLLAWAVWIQAARRVASLRRTPPNATSDEGGNGRKPP